MQKLTDKELIDQLRQRLEETKPSQEIQHLMQQLEQVNKKLRDAESIKSEFLSNVRNEILNPFAAILGLSESILMSDPNNWEHIRQMAKMIQSEALNLDFQLKNIFAAAAIEAGETHPYITLTDIEALLRDASSYLENEQEKQSVTISYSVQAPPQEIPGAHHAHKLYFKTDAEKLFLVLINLISNAIAYSNRGSSIVLKAWSEDHHLLLEVQDFGAGMDERQLEGIFERFRQGQMGSTKSHRGHGLGLSVVKSVVDLLDGKIEIRSTKQQGTTFAITLPEPSVRTPGIDGELFGREEIF